jgi:choline transport protein
MVVVYLQVAWFVTMVVVAASAPVHNDSKFVFRTWINNTGWENNVICFITGLVNPMYSLGGLDGISVGYSHSSETKEDVNHFIAYH